ncbi:MAG: glycosyltransferase family 2 protein [Anaerolineaceae bacterium]|nr:glycosyltransferase family 2 protein [Anaerolineaceae bacterium]
MAMIRNILDRWMIKRSHLFDRFYYLSNYPDVLKEGIDPIKHYLIHGAQEGRNPSPSFNTLAYYRLHPELMGQKINPLVHYIRHGAREKLPGGTANFSTRVAKDNDPLKGNRITFEDILSRLLLTDQKLYFPYDEDEESAIGAMESLRVSLTRKYLPLPQNHRVSIIMPTYNRANVILSAIESIIRQRYANWELLIVDDASTDDTEKVVRSISDERIRYFRSEENLGAAGARNIALEETRGEFICYLDSDNQMHPDFLLIMVNELLNRPNFDVIYCAQRLYNIEAGDQHQNGIRFSVFHRPTLENHNYIDTGVIFHRAQLEQPVRFTSSLRRLADWDFILQLTRHKPAYGIACILSDYFSKNVSNQATFTVDHEQPIAQIDSMHFTRQDTLIKPSFAPFGYQKFYCQDLEIHEYEKSPVSIVIPSYECLDYLKICLWSIKTYTQSIPYEVIIVDNDSSSEVKQYLHSVDGKDAIKVIYNSQNSGFTHAVNQGIAVSKFENDILVLNNDVLVTKNWLEALQEVKFLYPEVGVIVPSQVVLPGEASMFFHRPRCVVTRELDINISMHHWNILDPIFDPANGFMELSFAPFFCAYLPRTTLRMFGELDDENGLHHYSDRFYCNLLREHLQRKTIYTPKSKVYHFVQRATTQLSESDRLEYSFLLEKKWNR